MPILHIDTRILVKPCGILQIRSILLKILGIRSEILECFPVNRIHTKRDLIFQRNVTVHHITVSAHIV